MKYLKNGCITFREKNFPYIGLFKRLIVFNQSLKNLKIFQRGER